ncbi:MAG: hypothetical protein Q8900_12040 [Bacillota bacterium]|nr:hypothetical protein [Bacillota bacterium]
MYKSNLKPDESKSGPLNNAKHHSRSVKFKKDEEKLPDRNTKDKFTE